MPKMTRGGARGAAAARARAPAAPASSRRYMLTLQAADQDTLVTYGAKFPAFVADVGAEALVANPERAPTTGQHHWQVALLLKTQARPSRVSKSVLKIFEKSAHVEAMRGTRAEARTYCSKADTRIPGLATVYIGDEALWDVVEGERSDIAAAVEVVARLGYDVAVREHPEMIGTLVRCAEAIKGAAAAIRMPVRPALCASHLDWQRELWAILAGKPHERHIYFVYDEVGGKGKSFFTSQLVSYAGAVVLGGQYAAMAYQFCHLAVKPRIVIFDITRGQADYTGGMISLAEALKNGSLTSSRYQGVTATFAPPHVVFFTNDALIGSDKLSHDRIKSWAIAPLSEALMARLPEAQRPSHHFAEATRGVYFPADASWKALAKTVDAPPEPVPIFWDRHEEAPSDLEADLPDEAELHQFAPPGVYDSDDFAKEEWAAEHPDMAPPWGNFGEYLELPGETS